MVCSQADPGCFQLPSQNTVRRNFGEVQVLLGAWSQWAEEVTSLPGNRHQVIRPHAKPLSHSLRGSQSTVEENTCGRSLRQLINQEAERDKCLAYFLLFIQAGPRPMEWYVLQLEWVFSPNYQNQDYPSEARSDDPRTCQAESNNHHSPMPGFDMDMCG